MPRVSHRLERIARELQREVGNILISEAGDGRLHFVSVTKVELAPDLRTAKVFFSIIGNKEAQEACIQALERARKFIQRKISARMKMRFIPLLSFHKDDSIEGAIGVCKVIDSVVVQPNKAKDDGTEDDPASSEGRASEAKGEKPR
jgi:ribosome-binding factor A